MSYDVENVKNHPGMIRQGKPGTVHEKVHGSPCHAAVESDHTIVISSKGWAASQLVFAEGTDNICARICQRCHDELPGFARGDGGGDGTVGTIHILAEAYGSTVQDLRHGTVQDMLVFDVFCGCLHALQSDMATALRGLELRPVPLACKSPFSADILDGTRPGNHSHLGRRDMCARARSCDRHRSTRTDCTDASCQSQPVPRTRAGAAGPNTTMRLRQQSLPPQSDIRRPMGRTANQ